MSLSSKYREKLKGQIADYFGCGNILLTSSGRGAIYMILKSLPHRKVIVPAYTCEVVIEACKMAKKEIVFAHVDNETFNINCYPEIDNDTVVIATHQYGLPCEMQSLMNVCKEKGAVLIEDCAGSLGSRIEGRLTGTFGDFAVFSFSASKTIQSPTKGGFIIAKDAEQLKRVEECTKLLPSDAKFWIMQSLKSVGFCLNNSRYFTATLSRIAGSGTDGNDDAYMKDPSYRRGFYEWQAFVVNKQFEKLEENLAARQEMAMEYDRWIDNPLIQKPVRNNEAVNIRYAIQVRDRKSFIAHCKSNGVQVGKGYKKLMCPDSYLDEREISNNIVYLPFGNNFSHREIQKVIFTVNSYR